MAKRRHICGIACYQVKKGRLYHACKVCKHGTVTPVRNALPKLTRKQKACATKFVPQMMSEYKKGRWASKKQAIAVGLAKARKEC